ncbi:uncharacterized protein LACBIDRAFT_317144 [Laccaria bicolor S238N-H82]|uniref:Carboxylic ester hydrolase n=1 Tax=Laccaria bicolor (strain S238N-H82 / ATCC MYA-4686) TaxID=486041 RepID=B0D4I0_LACBS|nr:uncharacterized protein LACBIDRAFT_317144 [Laccaria bicolor S238N-H82]EDR10347.1 predicted protein [Laccaria bicolor S238N-H82]|eukprot:XP_001878797.1 predicted protein [Laccaria bicolor S238N-H82]
MVSPSLTFSAFLVLACAVGTSASPSVVNVVDLGYAKYQGSVNPTSKNTEFLGMRYPAPPTGTLRWREPQAPATTSGVQLANSQPNQCYQSTLGVAPSSPFRTSAVSRRDTPISEDCLFLNVWVPGTLQPNRKLPVLFWIHGGGYTLGSASGVIPGVFDGSDLIKEAGGNVVVVVIQYRLGVLGFLSSSQIKANGALNAGLLDQQFALKWVQQHISKFGGDPTKVTIWGESAGAGSVIQHIVANNGNTYPPLFRGAMTSSTFLPSQYNYNDRIPQSYYNSVVTQTKCNTVADTLNCLRNVDAAVLQAANMNIAASVFYGTWAPQPVVDGTFIADRPSVLLKKGKINGKMLLSIVNSHEGDAFVDQTTAATVQVPDYIANLFPNLGAQDITTAAKLYQGLGSNIEQANLIAGEPILVCPTYYLLKAFSGRVFKGESAVPPALHGADVNYYFTSFIPAGTSVNASLQTAFSGGFANFVQNLDPNDKSSGPNITPRWNTWSSQQHNEMLFNVTAAGVADVHAFQTNAGLLQRCAFWESVGAGTAI